MIPLPVIVLDVLDNCSAEMTFAEQDHATETLLLDRPDEPFGVGIRIRRPIGRQHDADARLL
jgi:hypothetical protein